MVSNGDLSRTVDGTATTTYTYDALGNLRSMTLPPGRVITYVIDGSNRRVGKKVDGTLVQAWIYSGSRIVAELDGAGAVASRFVYATAGAPDVVSRGGASYRVIKDHLGGIRRVIDASGAVVASMDYDEFGNVVAETEATGFAALPFGFAGGLYDRDTGLVRFGARDYEAATGRWTSKDPIRFGGGDANLYGYVVGDPVNLRDGSGLQAAGPVTAPSPGLWQAFFDFAKWAGAALSSPTIGAVGAGAGAAAVTVGIISIVGGDSAGPMGESGDAGVDEPYAGVCDEPETYRNVPKEDPRCDEFRLDCEAECFQDGRYASQLECERACLKERADEVGIKCKDS